MEGICANCGCKGPLKYGGYNRMFCSKGCLRVYAERSEREASETPEDALADKLVAEVRKDFVGFVRDALDELGVSGKPSVIQVKCQRVDCYHNWYHWCRKDDGIVAINEDKECGSYKKS